MSAGAPVTLAEFTPATSESNDPTAIAQADRAGIVTAVWQNNGLWSARRDSNGTWGSPQIIGSCPANFPNCVINYSLIVDDNGNATAAWSDWDAIYTHHVYVTSRPAAGSWSTPHLLAAGRAAGSDPWLSTGLDGTVLLTYSSWSARTGNSVAAVYRAPGMPWSSAPIRLFGHAQQATSGVSDNGTAIIVLRGVRQRDNLMRSYRYRPGVGWSRAHRLGIARHWDLAPYNLAVAANGRAVLAYLYDPTRTADAVGRPILRARIMNRHGRWGATTNLSAPGKVGTETPLVAMRGAATVMWSTSHGAIREATWSPRHAWKVHTAYPRNSGAVFVLERNFRGDLVLLWHHWSGMSVLYVGLRTYTGQWSQELAVPGATDDMFAWGSPTALPDGTGLVSTNGYGGSASAPTYKAIMQTVAPAS